MIFDTFLFFNELDLLRLRVEELDSVVDRFVLVESTLSHRGKQKPLFFSENKTMFEPWLDRIDVLLLDTSRIKGDDVHTNGLREKAAREALDAYPFPDGATICYSDADEIIRPEVIRAHRDCKELFWCEPRFYHFYLNLIERPAPPGARPVIAPARLVREMGFETIRWTHGFSPKTKAPMIPDACWHFAYLGDAHALRHKIANAVEGSGSDWVATESIETLQSRIDAGRQYDGSKQFEFVPIDESFPRYVQEHKSSLISRGLIKP